MADPSVELLGRDPAFRWYWAGQSLSFLGTQVTVVALPLVAVISLDAGAGEVSLVATAAMLPNLLLSLLVGHWAAGRDLRSLMIPADLVRAGLLAAVPGVWALGALSIPLLAAVAFLAGVAGVVFEICGFAFVPQLVEEPDLPAANRAVQGSSTTMQVAGPGFAGVLVQTVGAPFALVLDAASYLASALGVARASTSPQRRQGPGAEATSVERVPMTEGLRILFRNQYLRALTVHAAIYNLAAQVLTINLVLWLVDERNVSAGAYGLALTAAGVGAVLGTLTALKLSDRLGFGRAFAASLLLSCGTPLLIATLPFEEATLAAATAGILLVAGIGLGNANIYSLTLRQTVIPSLQLVRSNGAYRQVMYGSIPIGSAAAGVIGETAGVQTGVALGSIGLAASALPMLTHRIRRLTDPAAAKPKTTGPV